ncbi:MAG: DUF885 domain-containing protein, partial [Pseudomonadales bacterium]
MEKPSARTTKEASAQAKSVAAKFENELARELFDVAYDELLAMNPQRQTRLGIHENDDKWTEPSFEHSLARVELMEEHLESIEKALDVDKLNSQNRLSFDLFKYNTNQARRGLDFWWHQYPINQMFGVQSALPAFLINTHPGRNVTDLENYIQRLQGIEDYLDQVIQVLQDQEERGITPPNFVYDHALDDCKNVLTGAPFDAPDTDSPLFKNFQEKVRRLELVSNEEERLIQTAKKALTEHTGPAYQKLRDYLKSARERTEGNHGVWHLPDGGAWYKYSLKRNTTTDYSPEEIHSLGLSEVERIHDEIRTIMDQVDFDGSLQDFFAFMQTDDQFFVEDTEAGRQAYLDLAIGYISDMREALPEMVNTIPRFDLEVKAVEPYREKSAGKAFYSSPSPNGERPGIFYVNLYDVESVPTYELEALAYHEGIPGHHLQSAITLELEHLPRFRRYGHFTAYSEGWALYAEHFPKEFGFYEDPWSDFGRLAMELERAARLVVDTGIHHKRWSRERAITYLEENTSNSRYQAVKSIERYMVMPGQATAYKIGMNRILELR